MRLFLSSYRAGKFPDKFIQLFGKGCHVAVVTNAKDYKSPAERALSVNDMLSFFRILGMKPKEIDLRKYFKNSTGLDKTLETFDAIWMAGGNTFLLRRALSQSKIDQELVRWISQNKIIYGGESAGAILAGPTLKGSEDDSTHEDDPNYIPDVYKKEVIWEGMGLIDYVPVPHYKSEDYGESIDGYVKYLEGHKIPFKTVREDQAILLDGDKEEFLK